MKSSIELVTAAQDKAVQQLFNCHRLCVQWSTGVGKTRVGVNSISKLIEQTPDAKVLLCVAEVTHKDTWRDEFYEVLGMFEAEQVLSSCTIECYASLKKYADTSWNMIIFDEAHHLGSEFRLDLLMTLKADYVLALSATMKKEVLDELNVDFGRFMVNRYSLSKAIDDEILPNPTIITVPLILDSKHETEMFKVEWGSKKGRSSFGHAHYNAWKEIRYRHTAGSLKVWCTQAQKYSWICEEIEYAKKKYMMAGTDWLKTVWLQKASERKRILGSMKSEYIKKVIEKIKTDDADARLLCFCSSVEQAKKIGGVHAVHSKQTDKENKRLIDEFNSGESNELYAVGKLVEGVNLVDCKYLVMSQLDGELRLWTQKVGKRYCPYVLNSVEVKYKNKLRKRAYGLVIDSR